MSEPTEQATDGLNRPHQIFHYIGIMNAFLHRDAAGIRAETGRQLEEGDVADDVLIMQQRTKMLPGF